MASPSILLVWNMARVWTYSATPDDDDDVESKSPPATAILSVNGKIVAVGAVCDVCRALVNDDALIAKGASCTSAEVCRMVESSPPGRSFFEIQSNGGVPLSVTTVNGNGQQMVCPGFTDSHVHLLDGGKRLFSVTLRDCSSRFEFVKTIQDFIAREKIPSGEWITGGDWTDITLGSFPDKSWVDEATTDHFVLLARLDSHCAVVNSRVISAIPSLTDVTFAVPGGTIERNGEGEPTGLIKELAVGFVKRALWPLDDTSSRMEKALQYSGRYLQSHGITSVHVMSSLDFGNIGEIEFLAKEQKRLGKLPVRVRAAVRVHEIEALKRLIEREGRGEDISGEDKFLSVGMVKFFSDGSLGSRTAAMKRPYEGTCQCGFMLQSVEELRAGIQKAVDEGLQCCVHAIGDAAVGHAVDAIIDAVEATEAHAAAAGRPLPLRRRHRIEHCQHVDDIPVLFPRMATYNIAASCQPSHLLVDGPYAERELGASRMNGAYCFRSMLQYGVPLAFGSDWMVAPACVLSSLEAAVSRRFEDTSKGSDHAVKVWNAAECISLHDALTAYTVGSAASGHRDDHVGHLRPGYLADMAILSTDLFAPRESPSVAFTILNGDVVFDASPTSSE